MHEAGLLAAAVADALAAAGSGPGRPDERPARPAAVEIRVHDPIHVAPESARLHAELALRAYGWADVPIEIVADPVTCAACDVVNEARPEHPFCDACGWPLPDRDGHAVEALIRWDASAGEAPAGDAPFADPAPAPVAT